MRSPIARSVFEYEMKAAYRMSEAVRSEPPAPEGSHRRRIKAIVADEVSDFKVGGEFAADERRQPYRDDARVSVQAVRGKGEASRRRRIAAADREE